MVYKIDYPYGITISSRPMVGTLRQQFFEHYNVVKILRKSCYSYILFPEIDISLRMHMHGTLKVKDEKLFIQHIRRIKKELGFIKFESDLSLKWHLYQRKDWPLMKRLLKISQPPSTITRLTYGDKKHTLLKANIDYCVLQAELNTMKGNSERVTREERISVRDGFPPSH